MSDFVEINEYNVPKQSDYKHLDNREHLLKRASMYILNDNKLLRDEWVFDLDKKVMKVEEIDFTQGCERIFLEILSNASDNCGRSRRARVDTGKIEVTMNKYDIVVKNYGLPIPTCMHDTEGVYVPELIFGTVNSSSNYEGDRHEVGLNGIGSKATNVFSKRFEVYIENSVSKQSYKQVWENNMLICNKPVIRKYTGKISSTTISYTMDFKHFGYTEYPPEAFELFSRHTADTSFTSKVPTSFNELTFNYDNIKEYARLYFGDVVDNSIIHRQENPFVELLIMDTPDNGYHISFVNCMMTKDGGCHVESAIKAVGEPIVNMMNEHIMKKKKIDIKEKKSQMINLRDVKPHISLLLSCKLVNPDFNGQSKTELNKPVPKITIDSTTIDQIQNWELIKRLYAALEAKQYASLSKTDGKMSKFVELEKGRDAVQAGETKRMDCILCATEGKSGAGYMNVYISMLEDGPSFYGLLPLKGKCLNVMNVEKARANKNKEIILIKKMLGLKEGLDYTDPINFKTLRYGKFMICADSDKDGAHILGLIINFFHCHFPSLLKVPGFLIYKRTPILRMTKGKKVEKFYTQREYELWLTKQITAGTEKGWKAKYFKGLGTSLNGDVADDNKDERLVVTIYDEDAPKAINLAFHKDMRFERKDWILNFEERTDVDSMSNQPISLFINHEMILFSISDLKRSIPKLSDGCKESHRKILAGSHKLFNIGSLNANYTECRVVDLDSYCSREMVYHHGNDILGNVIIKMAQDFLGTNNINLFAPNGQYGSYYENGEDASSPRYPNTHPSVLFSYIFHQHDQALLVPMIDQGQEIEPETYFPVIPMILVNGAKGVATGFSTFIPNHNPLDIIHWLKSRLTGSINLPTLTPWYRGFEGTITIIDRKKNKYEDVEEEILDNDDDIDSDDEALERQNIKERPLLSFVTTGVYHIKNNNTIVITALPIGRSPKKYYDTILVAKMLKKKIIKKIVNKCTIDTVHFELKGYVGNPSMKSLYLRRRYSLSNMVLLDKNDRPIRYDTSNDIIETFYNDRYPIYKQRKSHMLLKIQNEIDKYQHQVKFISAILDKSLKIKNVEKSVIYNQLDMLKIPHIIYDKAKLSNLNKEEIASFSSMIDNLKKELIQLDKTSVNDLWLNDLKALEKKYKQVYKIK